MPLINVKLSNGAIPPVGEKQIAQNLTAALLSIEGDMRPLTGVIVERVKGGDWAIGGATLTYDNVHARPSKKAA